MHEKVRITVVPAYSRVCPAGDLWIRAAFPQRIISFSQRSAKAELKPLNSFQRVVAPHRTLAQPSRSAVARIFSSDWSSPVGSYTRARRAVGGEMTDARRRPGSARTRAFSALKIPRWRLPISLSVPSGFWSWPPGTMRWKSAGRARVVLPAEHLGVELAGRGRIVRGQVDKDQGVGGGHGALRSGGVFAALGGEDVEVEDRRLADHLAPVSRVRRHHPAGRRDRAGVTVSSMWKVGFRRQGYRRSARADGCAGAARDARLRAVERQGRALAGEGLALHPSRTRSQGIWFQSPRDLWLISPLRSRAPPPGFPAARCRRGPWSSCALPRRFGH